MKQYAGRAAMFRLMTLRSREASTPVIECGYRNSASADPKASVAYCSCAGPARSTPSPGFGDSANFSSAAPKISSQPPSL